MLSIYFCLDDNAPVLRCWPSAPRIGETVLLPELGGNLSPLQVFDVVWEGFDEPSVRVHVRRVCTDENRRAAVNKPDVDGGFQ
jgi:hypothetical protein